MYVYKMEKIWKFLYHRPYVIIQQNICPGIPPERFPLESHLLEFKMLLFKDTSPLNYIKATELLTVVQVKKTGIDLPYEKC